MNELFDHFRATEAALEGHFKLSSGLHSNRYLQCAKVLMHPERAAVLCRALAEKLGPQQLDLVVGPAIGGITFAYEMARALGLPGIFAERADNGFCLRRGFQIHPGQRVLIAEDVVTTGGSVNEVIAHLKTLGAEVLGVVSLVHRGQENPFEQPFTSLFSIDVEAWAEADCPMCEAGLAIQKPGSRPDATDQDNEASNHA